MIHFDFEYTTEKESIVVIKLIGSLIESSHAINLLNKVDEFIANGKSKFVLNMGEFIYMNSSGLSVIISLLTKARKNDGDVVICNITKKNNDLLIITKLNSVFTVCDNLPEALNSFN